MKKKKTEEDDEEENAEEERRKRRRRTKKKKTEEEDEEEANGGVGTTRTRRRTRSRSRRREGRGPRALRASGVRPMAHPPEEPLVVGEAAQPHLVQDGRALQPGPVVLLHPHVHHRPRLGGLQVGQGAQVWTQLRQTDRGIQV